LAWNIVEVTTRSVETGVGKGTSTPDGEATMRCHSIPAPAGADSETTSFSPWVAQIVVPFCELPIS
jgi:hypothetical protein